MDAASIRKGVGSLFRPKPGENLIGPPPKKTPDPFRNVVIQNPNATLFDILTFAKP